jgi:uncharacterized protein YecT (DUF1311 family)
MLLCHATTCMPISRRIGRKGERVRAKSANTLAAAPATNSLWGLLILSLLLLPADSIQANSTFPHDYPCEPGQNLLENVAECARVQKIESDIKLRNIYQRAVDCLSGDQKKNLESAELAWLTYRDRQATFNASTAHSDSDGQLYYLTWRDRAISRLTQSRIAELSRILDYCQAHHGTPGERPVGDEQ